MPDLKSMKRTPEEIVDDMKERAVCTGGMDEYPYGLRLHLDDESVEKVGGGPFSAGDVVTITALATIKSVNTHEEETEEGGEVKSNVELQITDMSIAGASNPKDNADKLYPSMREDKS